MSDKYLLKAMMFQLTAARRRLVEYIGRKTYTPNVSTHSRPKAAGAFLAQNTADERVSTHSRPKAAGQTYSPNLGQNPFQLTAARRRLAAPAPKKGSLRPVSTHSRPKAAGKVKVSTCTIKSFNSQPPEGGW